MASQQGCIPELRLDEEGLLVFMPLPMPSVLSCAICAEGIATRSRSQGSFGGKRPHISLAEHLRGVHNPSVQVKFRCLVCEDVLPGLRQANSHLSKLHTAGVEPSPGQFCFSADFFLLGLW